MHARLDGRAASLRCDVCGRRALVPDGDFDTMNAFLQMHKRCVPLGATA